jgi:hypothetical protein
VNAKRRVEYTRQLLESIGLEGQRLQMINISSAMGGQFAFAAAEITAEVRRMGPNRLRQNGRPASEAGGPEGQPEDSSAPSDEQEPHEHER